MLAKAALDIRNYIGRTQWWNSNYASDNVDFKGTIDDFKLYNTALTRKEICDLQGIEYKEKEYSSSLVNGDFEGQYSVMQSSGVSSDRAIYIPDGWKIDYSNPNNNDLTALTEGDLYYSNFFASRPKPMGGGEHSYWIRQNWGESTISLSQEVLLPEGEYTLSADMWKSGTGGNSYVYYQFGNNAKREITHDGNTEKWQKVECDFASDGVTPLTVGLYAVHTSNGSEKILGFDNIKISAISNFIKDVSCEKTMLTDVYAIDGFILLESDVLIRKSIDFLWDEQYAACGKVAYFKNPARREHDRLLPFLCYMNVAKLVENGARYYDPMRCWNLQPGRENPANWWDTGATLLDDIRKTKPALVCRCYPKLDDYYLHYRGGSWMSNDIENQKAWLERNRSLWQ
jgi:hypothetical protein